MNQSLIEAIRNLDEVARAAGVPNIFQPGLAKEFVIASALGHKVLTDKRGPDAITPDGKLCEYLSMLEGNPAQIDRMYASPPEKLERGLERITRNDLIYLAVFSREAQTQVLRVYDLDKDKVLASAREQLRRYKIPIGRLHFTEEFGSTCGKLVFVAEKV